MVYIGDNLDLYRHIFRLMEEGSLPLKQLTPGRGVTPSELATAANLHERWVREWMYQQASCGVLDRRADIGDEATFEISEAMHNVLTDQENTRFSCGMLSGFPFLMDRVVALPKCFSTGEGLTYDDGGVNVATAIERQHTKDFKHFLVQKVLPKVRNGELLEKLRSGCRIAEIGCGAGASLVALAKHFPKCEIHGFETSQHALQRSKVNLAAAGLLDRVQIHDVFSNPNALATNGPYDFALCFDVLHDAPHPDELMESVRQVINKDGCWLVVDIATCDDRAVDMVHKGGKASMYFGISLCLCMSSGLSAPGGMGLGTLGFTKKVARSLSEKAGWSDMITFTVSEMPTNSFFVFSP
ncbi:hypothetical protein CYMTET_47451 [Cymbomonas tetramitiformis]|uniref:Methyltransferase domain-containing protein n=1 Tax=Cymbomonas tetramitiformis TaxID=36881 RepID=A0AAE0BRM3_9CHLO|nr:hypothetical protein CYMTET_48748 [Cymbomonas tetramitiformis]KAK3242875.1 hypothetical protein CYMTET_47451 [Cymbomonas tetramitiformis]|eukprot:gene3352-4213_t